MQDQRFEKPVRVALGRSHNTVYTVDRVAQAADILLNRWPATAGTKHIAARKACLRVLEGLKEARHPFVEAAEEADILVDRDPFD